MKLNLDITTLKDVVWIQTGFIGDIILNSAACVWLQENHPHIRQHMITTALGASALEGQKFLTSLWSLDKRQKNFLLQALQLRKRLSKLVQNRERGVILQAHRSYRSSILAKILGLPTITYEESGFSWLADIRIPRVAHLHESQRIALLLQGLGIGRADFFAARPKLDPLALSGSEPTLGFLANTRRKFVGIAPGSVWATKRWTMAGYAGLTQRLLQDSDDTNIVLIGSKDETKEAAFIQAMLSPELKARVFDLVGKTSLQDLRKIFPKLSLLVGNDSSPIHYASAFNVPTVAIFGATTPELGFAPLAEKHRIVEKTLACRPCSEHGPKVCPLTHFRCMREIAVEDVFTAARYLVP